ncbi:MAG: glycosyltransferase [Acidimicrobiaceae bacterium]|nr:glycosyltransferase [Acidimicrobiaceae bacterium]
MPKRVLVISARMGAGHDGAARELCIRLEKRGHQTKLVDFLDASPRVGKFLKKTYELQLSKAPWTYELIYRFWTWSRALTPPLVLILSIFFEKRLRRWAHEFEADVIVTTYPFASVVLGRARVKRRNKLAIPVSTFLTDFAVHPLWVHKGVDAHICVHPRAAQAVYNLTGEFATAPGPLVSSVFSDTTESKSQTRRRLQIPEKATTVLIVAGSWGVGQLEDTFDSLISTGEFLPIVVCGRNEELAERLRRRGKGIVLGWTDEMAAYMRASDAVVQNAGGLTCMEAFASGLPVISYNPIPGHGRQNVFEMTAAGITKWARNPEGLRKIIREITSTGNELALQAKTIFVGSAADDVERLLFGETPSRIIPITRPVSRRFVGAIAAMAMLFISVNLVSNIATSNGLNIAPVSYASSQYVYMTVLVGPHNLGNSKVDTTLAHNNVAAIITGKTTLISPQGVSSLANNGVAIINGGWDSSSDLHLITPDNAAAHTMSLLEKLTNENINIYAPQMVVNSVDLAWAAVHHQTIVRPVQINLRPTSATQQFKAGQIYELNATTMTPQQLIAEVNNLKSTFAESDLQFSPIWTLR